MQRTIYIPPISTATEQQKLRVTAYCRVSIEREEEKSSLKSRVAHFSNEKYVGTLITQKTYVAYFLDGRQIKNNGEVAQQVFENHHNAIIEPEMFEKVQQEKQRRVIKQLVSITNFLFDIQRPRSILVNIQLLFYTLRKSFVAPATPKGWFRYE